MAMGRQSPWAKLWFLHAIPSAPEWASIGLEGPINTWVEKQLDDRHETVRAQAGWISALGSKLTQARLIELYTNASMVSQPALAACAKMQTDIPRNFSSGIVDDSPLNKAAAKWVDEEWQEINDT
jgi:RNA-directed DNA polymerase